MPSPGKRPSAASGATPATHLAVYVTPRAGRTEIAGERAGAIWIRLAASPVDGQANEALLAYLAKRLGLPRRAVRLVAGQSGRQKRVGVAGLDINAVRTRLGLDGGSAPIPPAPPASAPHPPRGTSL